MSRGHIRKRGKRWAVVVEREPDPITGKRRQRWASAATRKEAETLLTKLMRERDTGTDLDPTKLTVGEYLDHWLETDLKLRAEPNTYTHYAAQIRLHFKPHLGAVPLVKLQPLHISRLYASLLAGGRLSATSVNSCHQTLHGALRQAVRWELIPRNPADAVTPPRVERIPRAVWDAAITARFEDAVVDEPLGALFILAIGTGMRRGELLGLEWGDIDLAAGALAVRRARVPVKGVGMRVGPIKGKRGRRVDLSPPQVALLKEHRRRQLAERLAVGPEWEEHHLVFCMPGGRPVSSSTFSRRWHALLRRTGVPHQRPHDLRHLNATLLLKAGVHPKVVQERLGHASSKVTMDIYSHVTPSMSKEAAAILEATLEAARREQAADEDVAAADHA